MRLAVLGLVLLAVGCASPATTATGHPRFCIEVRCLRVPERPFPGDAPSKLGAAEGAALLAPGTVRADCRIWTAEGERFSLDVASLKTYLGNVSVEDGRIVPELKDARAGFSLEGEARLVRETGAIALVTTLAIASIHRIRELPIDVKEARPPARLNVEVPEIGLRELRARETLSPGEAIAFQAPLFNESHGSRGDWLVVLVTASLHSPP